MPAAAHGERRAAAVHGRVQGRAQGAGGCGRDGRGRAELALCQRGRRGAAVRQQVQGRRGQRRVQLAPGQRERGVPGRRRAGLPPRQGAHGAGRGGAELAPERLREERRLLGGGLRLGLPLPPGLVRQALGVDAEGRGLVPEVVNEPLPGLLEVLQLGLLGLLVLRQLLARLQRHRLVVLDPRGDGVRDVLRVHAPGAPGRAGAGELHRLVQGSDLEARVRDGAHDVLDLPFGLLDLVLQALPHLLVLGDPQLHRALRPGSGVLGGLAALLDELVVLLAEAPRGLLLLLRHAVQVRRPPLADELALPALAQGLVLLGLPPPGAGGAEAGRAGALAPQEHGVVAAGGRAEAHLVEAHGLRLVVDVAPELLQLRLELRDGGAGPPGGVRQPPLCLGDGGPLLLQGVLHDVTHQLALGPRVALLTVPAAELHRPLLGGQGRLHAAQRLPRELHRALQGIGPPLQGLHEAVAGVHLLLQGRGELVVHVEAALHGLLLGLPRVVALHDRGRLGVLRLGHVEASSVVP
mmetsp:Transcript_45646/g.145698  ORF Transcript_45646/g.145698 Transcript_45646/m.145698 type:complete len:522 (+) Transcript_45646:248-1813(+)